MFDVILQLSAQLVKYAFSLSTETGKVAQLNYNPYFV